MDKLFIFYLGGYLGKTLILSSETWEHIKKGNTNLTQNVIYI